MALQAKMFLADDRGCSESDRFRSYSTFNFGDFYQPNKQAFFNLSILNDVTIAAKHHLCVHIEQPSFFYLLPLVGSVVCHHSNGDHLIQPGQLFLVDCQNDSCLQISNPYECELVNFIWFAIHSTSTETDFNSQTITFNLEVNQNKLINISTLITPGSTSFPTSLHVSVGKFSGRNEAVFHPVNKQSSLFVFVIQGAFEVEGRLLHARDGLAL